MKGRRPLCAARWLALVAVAGVALLIGPASARAADVVIRGSAADSGAEQAQLAATAGGQVLMRIPALDAAVLRVPAHAAAELDRHAGVEVLADPPTRLLADPLQAQQWYLAPIEAPTAHGRFQGAGITVAVLDAGVDLDQPELAGRVVSGSDYINGDGVADDEHWHGTHVAGIIGAGVDGRGVVGVAPQSRILAIRVLDGAGQGTMSDLAAGIVEAADAGAAVINISLGGSIGSPLVIDALDYARARGALPVCAAGNAGTDQLSFPASDPRCVAVGSLGSSLQRSAFSNWGRGIDLVAPGEQILSTVPHGGWLSASGTSMATPQVAAAAALVAGAGHDPDAIQARLVATAADLGAAGVDDVYGAGLVRAGAAIEGLDFSDPDLADENGDADDTDSGDTGDESQSPTEHADPPRPAPICFDSRHRIGVGTVVRLAPDCATLDGADIVLRLAASSPATNANLDASGVRVRVSAAGSYTVQVIGRANGRDSRTATMRITAADRPAARPARWLRCAPKTAKRVRVRRATRVNLGCRSSSPLRYRWLKRPRDARSLRAGRFSYRPRRAGAAKARVEVRNRQGQRLVLSMRLTARR